MHPFVRTTVFESGMHGGTIFLTVEILGFRVWGLLSLRFSWGPWERKDGEGMTRMTFQEHLSCCQYLGYYWTSTGRSFV